MQTSLTSQNQRGFFLYVTIVIKVISSCSFIIICIHIEVWWEEGLVRLRRREERKLMAGEEWMGSKHLGGDITGSFVNIF